MDSLNSEEGNCVTNWFQQTGFKAMYIGEHICILGWIYIGVDIYVGVTEKVIGCIPGPSQVTHLIHPGQRTFRLQCEFKKCQEDTLRNDVMKIHNGEGID